jgi:hypothetical protein
VAVSGTRRVGVLVVTLLVVAHHLAPAAVGAPVGSAPAPVTGNPAALTAAVVVYGATPSGIVASIAARRTGAGTVMLIEPTAHVGGMMTSGLTATDYGDPATIGAISREFFDRMQAIEGTAQGRYNFQSRNAERVFRAMLTAAGVSVRPNTRLVEGAAAVTKNGARLTALTMEDGTVVTASVFIDASYEGDLMARAGVSYVVGREATTTYGEALAGVRPGQLLVRNAASVNLGFPVSAPGPAGSADGRIQDSNYRICLTATRANQVAFPQPADYDPANYDIVARYLAARAAGGATARLEWVLWLNPLVNGKYDANDYGAMSTAVPGANYAYPEASYAERAAIDAWHRSYDQGLLYFLRNDSRVPEAIRTRMAAYGLCKDEFTDNGSWPYRLYLREGRRMSGPTVLTSHDIQTLRSKPEIVAIGSYVMDSHYVSRYLDGAGNLYAEGGFASPQRVNYAIPYRIMTPRREQATNLLVPVTSSASHVAQSSLRMEPQYMMMGEAAGTAAWMAAAARIGVQDVSVASLQSKLRARGAVLTDPGDIGTSVFYADILWAYRAGIMSQCAPGRFCPTGTVTREMMAAFLARALRLPPASRDFFSDDRASPFQDSINRVAQAGITTGCTATTYCPAREVTREQMASFLVRAFRLPATSRDYFTDDGRSIHQADINRLAASGITKGCSTTRYCPSSPVSRGELMAFLHRAMT